MSDLSMDRSSYKDSIPSTVILFPWDNNKTSGYC